VGDKGANKEVDREAPLTAEDVLLIARSLSNAKFTIESARAMHMLVAKWVLPDAATRYDVRECFNFIVAADMAFVAMREHLIKQAQEAAAKAEVKCTIEDLEAIVDRTVTEASEQPEPNSNS
jgi:hypothetical protein